LIDDHFADGTATTDGVGHIFCLYVVGTCGQSTDSVNPGLSVGGIS
jgi:hypothetical protein